MLSAFSDSLSQPRRRPVLGAMRPRSVGMLLVRILSRLLVDSTLLQSRLQCNVPLYIVSRLFLEAFPSRIPYIVPKTLPWLLLASSALNSIRI